MAQPRSNKIIQVPMQEELLKQIDARAAIVAESRAAFIREAFQQPLKSLRAEELDRLYIDECLLRLSHRIESHERPTPND